jgi:hypothetical protein
MLNLGFESTSGSSFMSGAITSSISFSARVGAAFYCWIFSEDLSILSQSPARRNVVEGKAVFFIDGSIDTRGFYN